MSQSDTTMADSSQFFAAAASFVTAFEDRQGIHQFQSGVTGWKYLPQVNEWAAKQRRPIEWVVTRVSGQAHQPVFSAYPIWNNEHLTAYTRQGPNKQAAKEASAEAVAMSGHCV
ncbi:hypothetical protein BDW22DRAFT_1350110, partial [Trametopsis cervina]